MNEHVVNHWIDKDSRYVCFRHAVLASLHGKNVSLEVEDYGKAKSCRICDEILDEQILELEGNEDE